MKIVLLEPLGIS
ncbi:Protein of unknown function [Lactobacillus delbrueckii subsp. bulgaricus]|nr:Protein of unknown function [Lactobacillus delbrueckii subsp. bulgaricus]CDR74965.1 Protein of unknown function [Lactobacillus delbrueckii subsp. bulgaricus]